MKLPSFLGVIGGWQGYAAAAGVAALLSIAATSWLVSMPYRLIIAQMERDKAISEAFSYKAAADQFKGDAGLIHDAASHFLGQQIDLNQKLDQISRDFRNGLKTPLPANCAPDRERLQYLTAAIAAANTAAGYQSGPAVPKTP